MKITGFIKRLTTDRRPVVVTAENPAGVRVDLYVKPMLRRDRHSGAILLSEWAGYAVDRYLGLPVPPRHVVEITDDFVRKAAGQLDDVMPGPAFATEAVPLRIAAGPMVPGSSVFENPSSVAGITVGDSVVSCGDRHGENVVAEGIARRKYRLWYIDNGGTVTPRMTGLAPMPLCPLEPWLRALVTDEGDFGAFLFFAEALPGDVIAAEIATAPPEWFEDLPEGMATLMGDVYVGRGGACREALARHLRAHQGTFPNLRSA